MTMSKPRRIHSVTRITDVIAAGPEDCQSTVGTCPARSILFRVPMFSSNMTVPISPVATPEITIGR